jgi:hypothetical protein
MDILSEKIIFCFAISKEQSVYSIRYTFAFLVKMSFLKKFVILGEKKKACPLAKPYKSVEKRYPNPGRLRRLSILSTYII